MDFIVTVSRWLTPVWRYAMSMSHANVQALCVASGRVKHNASHRQRHASLLAGHQSPPPCTGHQIRSYSRSSQRQWLCAAQPRPVGWRRRPFVPAYSCVVRLLACQHGHNTITDGGGVLDPAESFYTPSSQSGGGHYVLSATRGS